MILFAVGLFVNLSVADMTGNLPNDKSANSISPQINQNFSNETDYKKLEKNISNLPKTEQEKFELDRLFIAISNTDLNATKEILDNNPNLINYENKNGERALIFLFKQKELNKPFDMKMLNLLLSYNPKLNFDIENKDFKLFEWLIYSKEFSNTKCQKCESELIIIFDKLIKNGLIFDNIDKEKDDKFAFLSHVVGIKKPFLFSYLINNSNAKINGILPYLAILYDEKIFGQRDSSNRIIPDYKHKIDKKYLNLLQNDEVIIGRTALFYYFDTIFSNYQLNTFEPISDVEYIIK